MTSSWPRPRGCPGTTGRRSPPRAWTEPDAAHAARPGAPAGPAERVFVATQACRKDTVHRAWVIGEYDGLGEILSRLEAAGVETAALSNICALHWAQTPRFPTVLRLGHRFGSHEIARCKPDPEAYEAVERGTGRRGGEILFFDDRPENVAAARGAGWRAAVVDPRRPTAGQITAALVTHGVLARARPCP